MDLPDIEDGADTLRRGSALPTVTDAPPPDGVGKPAAHPAVLHHLAASSPSQPEHRHRGGAARWWLVDAVTVAFLSLLALAYARPLVEEWIVLEYFDRAGIGGYKWFATLSPLRPLGAAPTVLQWLLGGDPWGFGLGFALMLAATYLVARWAVSTHVAGAPRWLLCVLATVLIPWPGEWLQRYGSAHLSVMLFWVALGCTLRLSRRRRVGWIGLGAAAIFLMLCSYQALTLCLLLLPAIAIAARIVRPATGRGGWLGVIGWSSAIPALGLLAYAGYSRIAPSIFGHNSYESLLINTQAQMRSLSGIASLVGSAYDTAYVQDPWTLVLIATLLAAVVGPRVMAAPSPIEQNRALAALAAALAALPLLAMPFAVNTAFLADPQKVDLPVAVGLVVLLVGGLVRYPGARPSPVQGADPASGPGSDPASDPGSDPGSNVVSGPRSGPQTGRKLASCLAVAALISTGILGLGARRQSAVEESVIGQTARLLKAHHASSVVVWDYTGRLGDLYSLYEFKHLLTLGVLARGTRVTTATICTPLGVDRVQPYAQHLHWALTPTCQALHLAPATLRLNAVGGPSGPILRSHG